MFAGNITGIDANQSKLFNISIFSSLLLRSLKEQTLPYPLVMKLKWIITGMIFMLGNMRVHIGTRKNLQPLQYYKWGYSKWKFVPKWTQNLKYLEPSGHYRHLETTWTTFCCETNPSRLHISCIILLLRQNWRIPIKGEVMPIFIRHIFRRIYGTSGNN